jgi:hypothetical protein
MRGVRHHDGPGDDHDAPSRDAADYDVARRCQDDLRDPVRHRRERPNESFGARLELRAKLEMEQDARLSRNFLNMT